MWKLVIEDDEGKRTVVPLTRDDYTLGRREGNTIRLTERNVSRDHALLRKKMNGAGTTFTLHDCSSYNGVYVNGVRVVDGQDLQHGDLIQIGDYRLILQDDSLSEQTAPGVLGQTAEDGKTTLPLGVTRGSLLLERPNRLVMLAGPMPGSEFPLTMERMTIGRAEDATISVNHNSVSRMHCEIHALGESRFEIVDKGSSNGVRVNGADLRRGIIEAGDIIELGDVRFKFVGAGQVFVPGVSESAQLEAISDRTASAALRQGTSPKAVWFLVLSVVALIGVGAWHFMRQPTTEVTNDNPRNTDALENQIIGEAKNLCANGNCDAAYRKLQELPATSPLRDSVDAKMIVGSWADSQFNKANLETDPARRRALLEELTKAPMVDPPRRSAASARLAQLDTPPAPPTITSGTAPQASVPAVTPSPNVPEKAVTPTPPTPKTPRVPDHTTTAKTQPNPGAQGGSTLEKARSMMLTDLAGAKLLLVPKVFGGKASRDETELLRTICKELRDQVCVARCKEILGQP